MNTTPPVSGFIGSFKTYEAARECAERWAYEDTAKQMGLTYVVSRSGDGQRWIVNEVPARYLPEGTPCQWCGAELVTLKERNESVCEACFQALDERHAAREAQIQAEAAQS